MCKLFRQGGFNLKSNTKLTEQGYHKLKDKLSTMKTTMYEELRDKIKYQRSFCDLNEDPEYSNAVMELEQLKKDIRELEYVIQEADIINDNNVKNAKFVNYGSTVTLKELPQGDEDTYTIVSSFEADPSLGRISDESPIGESLIGKQINDEVKVQTPDGPVLFIITDLK